MRVIAARAASTLPSASRSRARPGTGSSPCRLGRPVRLLGEGELAAQAVEVARLVQRQAERGVGGLGQPGLGARRSSPARRPTTRGPAAPPTGGRGTGRGRARGRAAPSTTRRAPRSTRRPGAGRRRPCTPRSPRSRRSRRRSVTPRRCSPAPSPRRGAACPPRPDPASARPGRTAGCRTRSRRGRRSGRRARRWRTRRSRPPRGRRPRASPSVRGTMSRPRATLGSAAPATSRSPRAGQPLALAIWPASTSSSPSQ